MMMHGLANFKLLVSFIYFYIRIVEYSKRKRHVATKPYKMECSHTIKKMNKKKGKFELFVNSNKKSQTKEKKKLSVTVLYV
jgi:hypothetical protein